MDFIKKRKADEIGNSIPTGTTPSSPLTPEEIRKIIEPFTKDQLIDIIQSPPDGDISLRKLFIRGLSAETTSETIQILFSSFGELEEAIVIHDKNTGKSKGFGFITFKHVDSAMLSIREPSKKIDGRITVTQLASNNSITTDVSLRKVYVGNVPFEVSSESLLGFFAMYGEIEEGPLGFDKLTGKSKGFAFLIYKNEEGAKAAIADPMKNIDGHQVVCKFAADNKKVNKNNQGVTGNSQNYGPASTNNYQMNTSMMGSGYNGAYRLPPYVGAGLNDGGLNNTGASMYRMPQTSGSGVYPETGSYAFPQHQQPSSIPPRLPQGAGGMYQGMPPPYY
ncbi:RNA recognition motif domain [Salix suchowensis]|nr:RNA recognition motif domain [Salix suchowensis]